MTPAQQRLHDPLLECLVLFARLYHRPVSKEALISGLPIQPGAAGPELFSLDRSRGLFSRVAKRAGFSSRLIQSDLGSLNELFLPCILVLKDRRACILDAIDQEHGKAKIILPEVEDGEEWIDLKKLDEQYLGFAFLLKKRYQYQRRSLQLIQARDSHWFWGTLRRSTGIYASVLLASFLINLFILATPMFTMNVYDRVVPNNAVETLWVLAIGVAIVYMFDTLLRFIRTYFLEIAGKKSDVIMSSILFEQTLNLRMDQWPKSVGAFANNLREFESLRGFFTAATLSTLIDLPFAVLFLAVIAYIAGALSLVPITAIAILLIYSAFLVRPLKRSIESTYEASANKHGLLVENLQAINTLKTLGATNQAQWEWEEATGEIADKSLRSRLLSSSITTATQLLMQLTTVVIVIAGVYMIKDQALSLGGLIAAVILASRSVAPMGQVASLITNYQHTRTAYDTLNELMSRKVERPEDMAFIRRPGFDGRIEAKQLGFSYPRSEKATLSNINIHISPGEHVGLIGKVGSGKSTIAKLLLGLYPPTAGSILIDDLDIGQIDPADLRNHVAYVSQEIALLRGTVRENILFKDPHLDDEQLLKASQLGGVDLFINNHPLGYDMQVGEQGGNLSGGQRQCIGIARALLIDTPIVIFDEPTSHMDNTTESIVRKRLYDHTQDKTLILITHKAAMLDLVERLIVIDDGRVVLDGKKEKVLAALQGEK